MPSTTPALAPDSASDDTQSCISTAANPTPKIKIPVLESSTFPTAKTISASSKASNGSSRQLPKKKNSKIGCKQCKGRKIKCDEQLPECRNCRIRSNSENRCSYLSFDESDVKYFLERKAENQRISELHQQKLASLKSNSSSPDPITSTSEKPIQIHIPLIKHSKPPPYYASQTIAFTEEPLDVLQIRLYLIKLLTESYFKFYDSFRAHLCLTAIWVHKQLSKANATDPKELEALYLVGMKKLHGCLQLLKERVGSLVKYQRRREYKNALFVYSEMVISTYCIQICDLIREGSLRLYYFEGIFNIINEFLKDTKGASPVGNYIAQSSYLYIQQSLYAPNYAPDVLYEIMDVLQGFKTTVKCRDPEDSMVLSDIDMLLAFIQDDLLVFLVDKNQQDPDFVLTYSPQKLYYSLHRFYSLFPSQSCVLPTTTNPLHRAYYSIYYAMARVLDNILPGTKYLAQFRFIGPSTLYPFSFEELREGLDDELLEFTNYFLRLLTFFHRRAHFFVSYMRITTPFPESLSVGKNRFRSRRAVVNEVFIHKFRDTLIKPEHYPRGRTTEFESPQYDVKGARLVPEEQFPSDFQAIFSSNLSFGDADFSKMQLSGSASVEGVVDFKHSATPQSGLLKGDYDPLNYEWSDQDANKTEVGADELNLYIDDRLTLMKEFVSNEDWFVNIV